MTAHDERLHVPWTWWPVIGFVVLLGVFEVGSGFTWPVLTVVACFLIGFFVVPLVISGRLRVRLVDGVLHAGRDRLPVSSIASVRPLDRQQTRLQLGPRADPAAHHVVRGWVGPSVVLQLTEPDRAPYWVVSTRHPDELAAAINAARDTESAALD